MTGESQDPAEMLRDCCEPSLGSLTLGNNHKQRLQHDLLTIMNKLASSALVTHLLNSSQPPELADSTQKTGSYECADDHRSSAGCLSGVPH